MRVFQIDRETYRDVFDGRGWVADSGAQIDEQQQLLIEMAYLDSDSDSEEYQERSQLLFDVWRLSRQLTVPSLGLLLTTAKTLRE